MKLAYLAACDSIHTVRWASEMAARGHEVHVISMQQGSEPLPASVQQHYLRFAAPWGYFTNVPGVRRLLRKINPALLHAHYASGYGTLGRLVQFHPWILSVWGTDVYRFPQASWFNRRLLIGNLSSADLVLSTSGAMAQQTLSLHPGLPHIAVTPFGIDTARFRPERGEDPSAEGLTIGTVKGLDAAYGVDILIRSVHELLRLLEKAGRQDLKRKLRLVIAGDVLPGSRERRQTYEALVAELGLGERTTFLGHVAHTQVPGVLNSFDIFAALSRYESFGVAALEASACGVPVVVSNAGGLPEVVEDGKTGFVVEKENIKAAALALLKLVESRELRREMGAAGRSFVQRKYEWSKCADEMERLYRQVSICPS